MQARTDPGDGGLGRWFQPMHYAHTPEYQAASQWAHEFVDQHAGVTADQAELVLDWARRLYEQVEERRRTIDEKALELVKTGGALLTGQVAIASLADVGLGWTFALSAFCTLGAIGIALLARRSIFKPALPSVEATATSLLDPSLQSKEHRELWVATLYAPLCAAQKSSVEWAAERNGWATWLLVAALALLAPTLWFAAN